MREQPILAKRIIIELPPEATVGVHDIVEACGYIAIVRTLDPDTAIVELQTTPDTFLQALKIARLIEKLLGAEILHPKPESGD